MTNFNPLFPYGKRRQDAPVMLTMDAIQSTLPIREETHGLYDLWELHGISIHSSHTGRDCLGPQGFDGADDFNPLFPYGKRLRRQWSLTRHRRFQSTLPIREETPSP